MKLTVQQKLYVEWNCWNYISINDYCKIIWLLSSL